MNFPILCKNGKSLTGYPMPKDGSIKSLLIITSRRLAALWKLGFALWGSIKEHEKAVPI